MSFGATALVRLWEVRYSRDKTYFLTFALNEDSNQPANPRSLISPLSA